jgi:DNA-binding transcriptional ArsR family regulator
MRAVGKITLDADTFRALASSTRLTVLKSLDERRKTLTELSRDLNLNKATVHEHMALLTAAGLVKKRDDEGRKWIYYELTWTGQRILHPEATTTFNLLLGLSVAAAGGGVAMLGRAMGWWLDDRQARGAAEDDGFSTADDLQAEPESASGQDGDQAAGAPASGSEAQENRALMVEDGSGGEPMEGGDSGPAFFDDGGWLSIALLLVCALFLGLAFILQRKLVPKPLDPASAAAAQAAEPDTASP